MKITIILSRKEPLVACSSDFLNYSLGIGKIYGGIALK